MYVNGQLIFDDFHFKDHYDHACTYSDLLGQRT